MLPSSSSSSQQSTLSSGQNGSIPVENETPNDHSSEASPPHDAHDWISFGLSRSGDADGELTDSQAGLSKGHSLQPPELKRLVASSWVDRNGTATACAQITVQNPSSGPSLYCDHYSVKDEELAGELGKVTKKTQLLGSTHNAAELDAGMSASPRSVRTMSKWMTSCS